MRSFVGLLVVFSCSLLLNTPAQAQTAGQGRKGTIAGRVMDSSAGVLQGAQITVEPPGGNVGADGQGQVFVDDLAAGGYTVSVPYAAVGALTQPAKFDASAADIVESVEINKTLQANMDGDGIGGSVNLVTKTAGERPTMNFSSMGGYTPILGGRGLTENTGTVGQRFGASKRIGVLIGGSYDWNGRGIDDIEPVPDLASVGGQQVRIFDSMDIREYRYYRSRWGLAGSADYKPSDGSD